MGQNLFQLMYNHKPKSNTPLQKSHKTADRKRGGVNPYGQPDRKISAFFFDDFPYLTGEMTVQGIPIVVGTLPR